MRVPMKTCAFLLLAMTGAAASAAVVNVDFDGQYQGYPTAATYSGTAAAPDTGTFWNSFLIQDAPDTPKTVFNLTASDGSTPTTIDVTLNGASGFSIRTDTGANFDQSGSDLLDDAAIQSPNNNGTPANFETFTIAGLTPGGLYDLYLYGTNGGTEGLGTAFTVDADGDPGTANVAQATTGGDGLGGTDNNGAGPFAYTAGVNYVYYPGVIADGNGEIDGTFGQLGGENAVLNSGNFNGLQIVAVPEPAVLSLLGIGALAALRRAGRPARK